MKWSVKNTKKQQQIIASVGLSRHKATILQLNFNNNKNDDDDDDNNNNHNITTGTDENRS